jgi:hypothetical protein
MNRFEALFKVPVEHRLVLVQSRPTRGDLFGEYWEHEEYDHRGKIVARFETFLETDPVMGTMRRAWYRYDPDGLVADWEEDLPELVLDSPPDNRAAAILTHG